MLPLFVPSDRWPNSSCELNVIENLLLIFVVMHARRGALRRLMELVVSVRYVSPVALSLVIYLLQISAICSPRFRAFDQY
jgi:hypothetical protein